MEVYIVTFKHGNYAIAAFNKLQGYGVKNIRLTQTPFSIKNECDLCIKVFNRDTLDIVLKECKGRFPVSNVYFGTYRNGTYVYKLLP
ncbi:MAG TPA: DUF3343 domain-containing protein [Tissierellia bacterium]|nr:DUF3343 domain-containing protein [Tissierellia bacterium]